MKKRVFISLTIFMLFTLSACGGNEELTAEADALRNQLAAAEETIRAAEEAIEAADAEIAGLEAQLESTRKELEDTLADKAALEAEIGADEDSGLITDMIDAQEPDIEACILLTGVAYDSPDREARCTPLLEKHYASVILKVTVMHLDGGGSEDWYLVWCGALNGPSHDIGWVPAEEVEEYTAENMTEIVWPVTLREGAELYLDEGFETAADRLFLSYRFFIRSCGEEVSVLGTPGDGLSFYVKNEDIIYPEP